MESTDKGFHCKSCDHILMDFREKTNDEIRRELKVNGGKTCGIFHSTQLNSKISTTQIPAHKVIGFSLLGILGFLGPVLTSCENDHPEVVTKKKNAFNLLKFPMKIAGTVNDGKTGQTFPHFKVEILQKGKVIKTALTDENGNFSILVDKKDLKNEQFKLAFGGFNYYQDTISTSISKFQSSKVRLSIRAESIQIPEPSATAYYPFAITSGSVICLDNEPLPPKEEIHIVEGVIKDGAVSAEIVIPDEKK